MLTVERGKSDSHRRRGWEPFADTVISVVNVTPGPIVFLPWVRAAQAQGALIDRRCHVVFDAAHPSPYSVTGFRGHSGFVAGNGEFAEPRSPRDRLETWVGARAHRVIAPLGS